MCLDCLIFAILTVLFALTVSCVPHIRSIAVVKNIKKYRKEMERAVRPRYTTIALTVLYVP